MTFSQYHRHWIKQFLEVTRLMPERAEIIDPVVLIRVPRALRPGMSDVALYEATRGIWRIGARREDMPYALAVYRGVVQEVYEIGHWQPALTAPYTTRTSEHGLEQGRWEFVGKTAADNIRSRHLI